MKQASAVLLFFCTFQGLMFSRDLNSRSIETSLPHPRDTTLALRNPGELVPEESSSGFPFTTTLCISGAAVLTAGFIETDQQTYTLLDRWRHHSRLLGTISPFVTNFGDGRYSIGLFGSWLSYGLLFNQPDAAQFGKIGLESFAATGVTVQMMKLLFGREQPNMATAPRGAWHGPFSYFRRRPLTGMGSYDAFPSGHTATVFAAATVIADWYHSPWVSYTSYSVATAVAVSRVMERMHWVSDCFVGGIIGVVGTRFVEKINLPEASLSIQPTARQGTYGVRFAYLLQ